MDSLLPDWLEPLVKLEDFNGDADKYIKRIFAIFERDFVLSKPKFRDKVVLHDKGLDGNKPRTFVHITTESNGKGERILSLRRCERIGWIKAIIEHADDSAILVWEKEQATTKREAIRIYLFMEKQDFLVILQEIKWGHYLITAVYVDNPRQKAKHIRAYEKSKNGSK